MTTKVSRSDQKRTFDNIVREQLDAFERKERQMRAEERLERARKLRLPVAVQSGQSPRQPGIGSMRSRRSRESGSGSDLRQPHGRAGEIGAREDAGSATQ
jgi:hypothetical protein